MPKKILVINSGSATVKYAVYDQDALELNDRGQCKTLQELFVHLKELPYFSEINVVGHRVVHGGTIFFDPVIIDAKVMEQLEDLIPLAPLHLPHNIAGINVIAEKFPYLIQVACFDTAFHRTQSELAKLFAIPAELSAEGIIRYGFHGLSYEYIASVITEKLGISKESKTIIAHLGNGASMCAIQDGKSVATTMGFSALDGLMMGTRCGAIDPGVLLYLLQEKNYSVNELQKLLYFESGLLGVSGLTNDMRELLESVSPAAKLAVDLFCYRAACEIGSLCVTLQGCDALIFTGGIGERAAPIREKICNWLKWLGVQIAPAANLGNNTVISTVGSAMIAAVIATDEEIIIASHTRNISSNID